MPRNMKRMEFSDLEPAEDGGVDLSLGLSIGGSSRRATNPGPTRHGTATRFGSGEAVGDLGEGLPFDGGDPLRRQEARKNGFLDGGNGVPAEDRTAMEVQALELRTRDRAAREREAFAADRWSPSRRGWESDGRIAGIARIPSLNPNNPNTVAYGSHPFPAMAMQHPYHRVQYLPLPNVLGFPFVMPCWAPAVFPMAADGSTHAEMNVLQQVAGRSPPVSVPAANADGGISGARYLDVKGGNGIGVNGAPTSINSSGSCSSGVSDHKSGSLRGSSISNDAKPGSQLSSQVSNSQGHQSHHVVAPLSQGSEDGTEKIITSTPGSSLVLNSATSAMGKLDGATSANKPVSSAEDHNPNGSSSLPRMPYVSTTGNGPNGRTITGFLYRYTKSEVSIICVCHGSSFSPEEFVRHAGSTNVSHPLRQIVVVP